MLLDIIAGCIAWKFPRIPSPLFLRRSDNRWLLPSPDTAHICTSESFSSSCSTQSVIWRINANRLSVRIDFGIGTFYQRPILNRYGLGSKVGYGFILATFIWEGIESTHCLRYPTCGCPWRYRRRVLYAPPITGRSLYSATVGNVSSSILMRNMRDKCSIEIL